MSSKRIKLRLSTQSAKDAIAEIEAYRDSIKRAVNELGQELVSEGVFTAKTWIIAYDAVESGQLLNSIEGVFDEGTGKGFIRTNSGHAAFVEYGTGVIGEESKAISPDRPEGWEYDVNEHGHYGWYYANGRWTKGMPPRPFMWNTFKDLCDKADALVRLKLHG